jgi:hypothetical protein
MSRNLAGNMAATKVCYLCGEALKDPTNRDHIPPNLFFADIIRQRYNLSRLLTTKVHEQCNTSYRLDEEYLVYTHPDSSGILKSPPVHATELKGVEAVKTHRPGAGAFGRTHAGNRPALICCLKFVPSRTVDARRVRKLGKGRW